ncbi:MAG: hypothetical protein IKS87_08520 [Lachnospiraceae bacterium]|nr:hypothetical protein [Lachnospiraceae bacterium]
MMIGSIGYGSSYAGRIDRPAAIKNPGESMHVSPGRKSSPAECETCKNRKYQDGSNEMVSFKAAAHISPQASASRVMAHEMEHVANAYSKAEQKNGQVVQASVTLHTAICPECGRSYVSGGETRTAIQYNNEKNPYQKDRKAIQGDALRGANIDLAV